MDDIVARLRQSHRVGCDCFGCEAADEIERLRVIVQGWEHSARNAERDIAQLREERDEARHAESVAIATLQGVIEERQRLQAELAAWADAYPDADEFDGRCE